MPVPKRTLRPDSQGRYRPYLGIRIDGKQPHFNLGTDTKAGKKAPPKAKPLRASELRRQGLKPNEIASALGVSRRTVHRYLEGNGDG
jgi:DNA invertase Pin-like site-specific DNA recombinase